MSSDFGIHDLLSSRFIFGEDKWFSLTGDKPLQTNSASHIFRSQYPGQLRSLYINQEHQLDSLAT